MWFSNITVFQLRESQELSADVLAKGLSNGEFRPCLSQELSSAGWVPAAGRDTENLVHETDGCLLFCLQTEEKIMPPAVVKELLVEQVSDIEQREGRTVRRKEQERMRDEIMLDLLPRAFSRHRQTHAYLDTRESWLIINSASPKAVSDLTERLRKSLGSLLIEPLQVNDAPAMVMTQWLAEGQAPQDFELADECELRDGDGVVRCKGQDLLGDEIRVHLDAGKQVTRLALSWDERLSLLLCEDLCLRRLKFLDLIQEQIEDGNAETALEILDARMALMGGELRRLLRHLTSLLGGPIE